MTLYRWSVQLLKHPRVNRLWRHLSARRGYTVGNYGDLPRLIREHAPGKSFADIGCMWGVNGEHSFIAEEAGATRVAAVDIFGPTPEFEEKRITLKSRVEFVLGDVTRPETLARIGRVDVVFCAGVLYHHPSPFDVLVALRRICARTLILRTASIPEVPGLPNAAVYFPMLRENDRALWNLQRLGVSYQAGISSAFDPADGYGNWFWGLSPSCLESLLKTAGFHIDMRATEAFAQTVIASPASEPFDHRLPGEEQARVVGAEISASGVARPA